MRGINLRTVSRWWPSIVNMSRGDKQMSGKVFACLLAVASGLQQFSVVVTNFYFSLRCRLDPTYGAHAKWASSRQLSMVEAWRRNHRWLMSYWVSIETLKTQAVLPISDRNIAVKPYTHFKLSCLGLKHFRPQAEITTEARAQDVLDLINRPSITQVRAVRFLGAAAREFNATSARTP